MFGISAATAASLAVAGASAYSASKQAKAGKAGTTEKKEMDPAMRPYIFGEEGKQRGLLDYNREGLERSQSPERMQGWQNIMNRGQGLLGGAVAGNPFTNGYQGGRNVGLFSGTGGGMNSGLSQYTPPPMQPPAQQQPMQQPPQMTMEQMYAEWERKRQAELMAAASGYYIQDGGPGNGPGADGGTGVGDAGNGGPGTAGNAGNDGGPGGVGGW